MNKIRKQMPDEVDAFIPVLRETYRLIVEYQFNRTEENEVKLRLQLMHATKEMQKFKPLLQRKWQIYIDALEQQQKFPISDLFLALDCAIHQMHLRIGESARGVIREVERIDSLAPWGREMKNFLDERRKTS